MKVKLTDDVINHRLYLIKPMVSLLKQWLNVNSITKRKMAQLVGSSAPQMTKIFTEATLYKHWPEIYMDYIIRLGGCIDINVTCDHELKSKLHHDYKKVADLKDWLERIIRQIMANKDVDYRLTLEEHLIRNPDGFWLSNYYVFKNLLPTTLMRHASVLGCAFEITIRLGDLEPVKIILDERVRAATKTNSGSKTVNTFDNLDFVKITRTPKVKTVSSTALGDSLRQFL